MFVNNILLSSIRFIIKKSVPYPFCIIVHKTPQLRTRVVDKQDMDEVQHDSKRDIVEGMS